MRTLAPVSARSCWITAPRTPITRPARSVGHRSRRDTVTVAPGGAAAAGGRGQGGDEAATAPANAAAAVAREDAGAGADPGACPPSLGLLAMILANASSAARTEGWLPETETTWSRSPTYTCGWVPGPDTWMPALDSRRRSCTSMRLWRRFGGRQGRRGREAAAPRRAPHLNGGAPPSNDGSGLGFGDDESDLEGRLRGPRRLLRVFAGRRGRIGASTFASSLQKRGVGSSVTAE